MSVEKTRKWAIALTAIALFSAILIGVLLGLGLAETRNVINQEKFKVFNPALPSRLLDINGEVITEFASEQKREMIAFNDLPPHLVNALLSREDQVFYSHKGFSLKAIVRAVAGKLTGRNLGGGSTITQQLAGTLYCDRTDYSYGRKLKELWWAIQLERRYSKNEIIEQYLNEVFFGDGNAGAAAASRYYFEHSVEDITPAEAAILVIQLSNPAGNNPFAHPDNARIRQIDVLDNMVDMGFLSREDADASFEEYWQNFDYTRVKSSSYFTRNDKAPWFSEYVRRQLNDMLYGTLDYTKDGFTVHTTLNLQHQAAADLQMAAGLKRANDSFRSTVSTRFEDADSKYIPMTEMISLMFNIEPLAVSESRSKVKAISDFKRELGPTAEVMSLIFGIDSLKTICAKVNMNSKEDKQKTTVEGALITIENETGYITSLVGGSKFTPENQLIRAVQAALQPGSSFKGLLYSAAIDSRKFTPATMLYDVPMAFQKDDGNPYLLTNYMGTWEGSVLLWYALATSMNVPTIQVLSGIGLDACITRAAALLDVRGKENIEKTFPRVYSLALGVIDVTPLQMARAYSVFANQGKAVTPISIRSVEDRNGKTILDPEKDLRMEQKRQQESLQIVTPQTAYVMSSLLQNTVKRGTLRNPSDGERKFRFNDANGATFIMPMAGKTGTTQNWADAWTVGFSPYYTTAVWFGFDKRGNSLGTKLTGSTLSGYVWADYMRNIHTGLPYRGFVRPQTGVVEATVCAKSGKLPTDLCNDGTVTCMFLEGTQPTEYCDYHERSIDIRASGENRLRSSAMSALPSQVAKDSKKYRSSSRRRKPAADLTLPSFIYKYAKKYDDGELSSDESISTSVDTNSFDTDSSIEEAFDSSDAALDETSFDTPQNTNVPQNELSDDSTEDIFGDMFGDESEDTETEEIPQTDSEETTFNPFF